MFSFSFTIHQHIIKIYEDPMVQQFEEHLIHNPLKCRRGTHESKWHNLELISAIATSESRFTLILFSNRDLVISIAQIQLAEDSSTIQTLQKFIDAWQWKGVRDSLGIEHPVVYTHPELAIFLFGEEYGSPIGTTGWLNPVTVQELLKLLLKLNQFHIV